MTHQEREVIKKQLSKIEDIASILPFAYGYSLKEAAGMISDILMKEGESDAKSKRVS